MSLINVRSGRTVILAAVLTLVISSWASAASAPKNRDVLWDMVTSCLDPGVPNYCKKCRWPLTESACGAKLTCNQTTEIWAKTNDFVAVRDRKMCGCPDDFVHGLAIPRSRVAGVEDPRRPEGIWPFAWDLALRRIGDPREAALAVNPPRTRAQDQLHVHIARLQKGARENFCINFTTRVPNLEHVWADAARLASSAGMSDSPDYGILVTTHPDGGFIIVVDRKSPEKEFLQEGCNQDRQMLEQGKVQ